METADLTFLEFVSIVLLVWASSFVETLDPYLGFFVGISGMIWIGFRIFQGKKSDKRAEEKRAEERRVAQFLEEKRVEEKKEHLLRMKKLRRELGEDV